MNSLNDEKFGDLIADDSLCYTISAPTPGNDCGCSEDEAGDDWGFRWRLAVEEGLDGLFRDLEASGFTLSSSGAAEKDLQPRQGSEEPPELPRVTSSNSRDVVVLMVSELLRALVEEGERALTIVREDYHIDPIFRDCYYACYSRQHFDTLRHSQRISFFKGSISEPEFYRASEAGLQEKFMGSCVINPVRVGTIGRTLVNPRYMTASASDGSRVENAVVRVSNFKITVMGRPLHVKAFPYRTQDGVLLRCVEVTIINLVEYYSNEYGEYGFVTGSRLNELESHHVNERTLPARGIKYDDASKLLSALGFQPQLNSMDGRGNKDALRREMHIYLDSGMPVAMNVVTDNDRRGHSLLCIGYSPVGEPEVGKCPEPAYLFKDTDFVSPIDQMRGGQGGGDIEQYAERVDAWENAKACELVLASDYNYRYVVMDDNQPPYRVRDFEQLSLYGRMHNNVFLVALHRGIMMDAYDAQSNVIQLLSESTTGLFNWARDYLEEECGDKTPRVVLRLFLASSRRFKRERIEKFKEDKDYFRATLYGYVPFPHFVWVAELYLDKKNAWMLDKDSRAFAELVIDATHSPTDDIEDGVVIWNYPYRVAYRLPDGAPGILDDLPYGKMKDALPERFMGIQQFHGNLSPLVE